MDNHKLLDPIIKGNISDVIVERITQQLLTKELKPGDKLPTEQEFCTSLGVSRNVVRDAIKVLVTLGVVEIRRPEGTFIVKEYSQKLLNPVMYGLILSDRNMTELLELHNAMLREILLLARKRITDLELEQLTELYNELKVCMFQSENVEKMYELSTRFYQTLCKITKNQLLIQVYDVLLCIFSDARYKGFANSVSTNRREMHFHNYELIMDIINNRLSFTLDEACDKIHTTFKEILL
ncbi:MAG: GntR family transcriptional regulator [Firmicutes bacterium]|nr:GntR family transcriptional regulator [Bacillota bacterium]